VPLTYTLMMVACLSEKPGDRPNFDQIVTVLQDIKDEVSSGCYLNSEGTPQVRRDMLSRFLSKTAKQALWYYERSPKNISSWFPTMR
jgi:hypothetical protein